MNICQYSSNDICAYVGSSVANMCGIIHCGTTRVPCQWVALISNSWRRWGFTRWNDTVPDFDCTITRRFRRSDHRKSARKTSFDFLNLLRLHLVYIRWGNLYAPSEKLLLRSVFPSVGPRRLSYVSLSSTVENLLICRGFGTQEEMSHWSCSLPSIVWKVVEGGFIIFFF